MPGEDILIFVEDPGAANYIAPLPAEFEKHGWQTMVLAEGHAKDYLRQRGISVEKVLHPPSVESILRSTGPRLLIVGTSENPDTLGLQLIKEARARGITTMGVVDFPSNADYRFRGRSDNALTYAPDWLLVPDAWTKEAYVALGYPAEGVIVCGHPQYDQVLVTRERLMQQDRNGLRRSLFPGLRDVQRVIVFIAEISTGLNPKQYRRSCEYTFTGRGRGTGRTEIVIEEFLDAIQYALPRPYLVLRLHPKNTADEFSSYIREFDQVSKNELPLNLIYAADMVVGMTSMLLFEAALMGLSTLSIIPRVIEKAWLPSIRMGITPCATTRGQLRSFFEDLSGTISQKTVREINEYVVFGSLRRIAEFCKHLLEVGQENG